MKRGLTVGVAALAALVAVAAAVRLSRGPADEEEAPASQPPPVKAAIAAVPDLIEAEPDPASPPGKALHILRRLLDLAARAKGRRVLKADASEEELTLEKSEREEALRLEEDLREILATQPAEWRGVLEIIGKYGESSVALDMVDRLATPEAEAASTEVIGTSDSVPERRVAVKALRAGTSQGSLETLLVTSERDPDARVRLEAIQALLKRQRKGLTEDQDVRVRERIRAASQLDADAGVRRFTLRMTPEGREAAKPPLTNQEREALLKKAREKIQAQMRKAREARKAEQEGQKQEP